MAETYGVELPDGSVLFGAPVTSPDETPWLGSVDGYAYQRAKLGVSICPHCSGSGFTTRREMDHEGEMIKVHDDCRACGASGYLR